eukprot:jgi/Picsp_1/2666/NSC_00896-R1_expressed protein [Chlorella variabilis]
MLFRYVLLLAVLHFQAHAQYGTETGCLDADCTQRLDALLHRYEDATDSVGECDTSCLANCYQVLEEAIYSTSGRSCPPVEDISSCMNVYYAEWVEFVQECPLFTFKDSAEDEAESEAPEAAESEAESEAPEAAESEAESEAPEAAESEAESEAPEAAESEAESEAPEAAESEAESEAPEAAESEAESEGESDSEAEGEGECGGESSGGEGEGEGEGSASGQGCFPEFANLEEFETYVQGAYYSSIWNKPSNTVGIILSVLFWVGLGCMGVYLGRK